MNLQRLGINFQSNGRTLMGRAVETEARRRILIAAIALQRFKLARGEYPAALQELVPAFLKSVPRDVIDGRQLRYRRHDGDSFVLYSIGLDGVDNGGTAVVTEQLGDSRRMQIAASFRRVGTDIV